ncbi:MAG: METTL5 family protein [Candidatus Verstraetearchaeota archaeon]|jgi:putative methylase|nr:METTL5 family protein [Candidatus Verstraetearchaeota archaeon]
MLLSKVDEHPKPKVSLEQYTLMSEEVSDILWTIETTFGDISGKVLVDLGCGTGRLAIGSALLGASYVVGVDIDEVALRVAATSAKELGVEDRTSWVLASVESFYMRADVVIQNPPYGVRRKGADRPFLEAALRIAPIVYSLHKSGLRNRQFLKRFIKDLGGIVDSIIPLEVTIRPTFEFHVKRGYKVKVDLYRIMRGEG